MTVDEIDAVIKHHLFSYKYRCECGEWIGSNPLAMSRHLARKIHEAMEEA